MIRDFTLFYLGGCICMSVVAYAGANVRYMKHGMPKHRAFYAALTASIFWPVSLYLFLTHKPKPEKPPCED